MLVWQQLMIAKADAFLALPGGIGTLEEMFEAWTLFTLGFTEKPVGVLNVRGFYNALLAQLNHAMKEGLLSDHQFAALHVGDDVKMLCAELRAHIRKGR
jgi:uncharacterized protein (TIGR00730 family)